MWPKPIRLSADVVAQQESHEFAISFDVTHVSEQDEHSRYQQSAIRHLS
jgi:hypothetical protein